MKGDYASGDVLGFLSNSFILDESEPLLTENSSWESKLMLDLFTINLNSETSEENEYERASSPVCNGEKIFQIQMKVRKN